MPAIDFQEVRKWATMDAVLDGLHWMPFSRRGAELRGPCPIHGSKNPRSRSFSVDIRGNRFQCFSCGAKGNQLDLFAQVRKLELYEAAVELCRLVGIDVPYVDSREQRRGARPAAASLQGGAQVAPNRASPPSEHRQAANDSRPKSDKLPGQVEPLITKAEAARLLNVCVRTVDNMVASGRLKLVKLGTAARIDPRDLRAFIDAAKEPDVTPH